MFKDAFKYYKSRNPTPELSKVFDFNNVEKFSEKVYFNFVFISSNN